MKTDGILSWRGKKFVCLLLAVCVLGSFSGCTIGERQVYFSAGAGWGNLFRIGSLKCSMKEARLYLANYKNLYGTVGELSLWSDGFQTEAMADAMKQSVVDYLSRVYALNIYARENEVTLSEREEESVKKAAEEYYTSLSEEERETLSVKKSDIEAMYERYALARKVYLELMDQVDEEVSEDEARIMDAYVLKVTEEEQAQTITRLLASGEDFESLLRTYGQGETAPISFGRGTFEEKMEEVIFQLDNEEVSDCITASDGYYFVYCINKYDEQLSEENKANVVERRKEQVILDIIAGQVNAYYSEINQENLDKLSIDEVSGVSTESFFTILENYLS